MANGVVEAFSLSHAQVLDGTQTFLEALTAPGGVAEWLDIYGVNEASLEPDTDDYDNEGDDVVLSNWAWLNFADLTVQAGYFSFPLVASLTNRPVSSTGGANPTEFGIDLWHEDSFNVAPKPVLLAMPSKDKRGVPGRLYFGLYRAQFKPITFDGPAYKDGLKVNYDAKALYSEVDEKGVAFPDGKKRIGRVLWRQTA